jgi:excisionase family DNA binding protein
MQPSDRFGRADQRERDQLEHVAARRPVQLGPEQLAVLQWIGGGCPDGQWPDHNHKIRAHALARRGLAMVFRYRGKFAARATDAGRYLLEHGELPPDLSDDALAHRVPKPRLKTSATPEMETDATARLIRKMANPRPATQPREFKREIKETYVRFRIVVTRVQVAERYYRATDAEDAAAKAQAEFDRPYGYFGSWKTVGTDVDVTAAEQTTVIAPTDLSPAGPMLLSIKDAAKALGVSPSVLYQMTSQGDIDWVSIGNRKYISRETLLEFIKQNTHNGYRIA